MDGRALPDDYAGVDGFGSADVGILVLWKTMKAKTNHGLELLAQYLDDVQMEEFIERCFNQFQMAFKPLEVKEIGGALFFEIETADGEVHTVAA